MKKRFLLLPQLVLLATLPLALTVSQTGQSQGTIKVDGSSTVFPITEAVAEEFQNAQKGKLRVTVGISGTGGGFKKFCRGETDVQDASRPITKEEMAACKKTGVAYYELPIAFDAIAVVVNPKNDWVKDLTVDDLKKIWDPAARGKVSTWKQVRSTWPDAPMKLFGPGADSGTFDYFTEAVVGKAKASRGDFTASEDDNTLVQGVSNDKNALGYFSYSYYEPNKAKLKIVGIDGGAKAPKQGSIVPSAQTVENGTYFPLSRPIFIYVSAKATARPEVAAFVEFYLNNAAALATQVKYVSLPKEAYTMALDRFHKKHLGTAFRGESEVGLDIKELLKRESQL